ncbi:MAG: hypothetical protein PHH45_03220 [Patescibacteria group bacterium]|jgi:uncharacterized protein YebE (UPF0316 family)|nr:hypothetical protein [Patescibacteria group bacterium]
MYVLIFFVAGIVQDFVVTLNWRYIAKEKVLLASLFSFLTTVITLGVLYSILTRLDETRSIPAILAYSIGVATGTFIAMKVKIRE